MCGIIHCKRKDGKLANKPILKRFEKQKSRGTEGFGFIEINDGIVGAEIRTRTEKEIKEKLAQSTATEIMFHHRTPTSTPNFIEATHPIKVSHKSLIYDYYVMHNGIISNDDKLRDKHLDNGFIYTTEIVKKWITSGKTYIDKMWNDSEALAIDFCLAIEKGTEITAEGSIAMVALQFSKKNRKAVALFFCRNAGNPLKVEDGKDFFCISSESGKEIPKDTLYRLDYVKGELRYEKKTIGKFIYDYETGYGYNGYAGSYNYMDYENDTPYTRWDKKGKPNGEDDFDMELWEERQLLEDDMRVAEMNGDYDAMTDLAVKIEEIDLEIAGIDSDDMAEAEAMEGDIEKLGVGHHINKKAQKLGF